MEIEYELTPEQYWNAHNYVYRRYRSGQSYDWISVLLFWPMIIGITFGAGFYTAEGGFIVGAVLAVGKYISTYGFVAKRRWLKSQKSASAHYFGLTKVTINKDSFVREHDGWSYSMAWNLVKGVHVYKGCAIVVTIGNQFSPIPLEAFADPAEAENFQSALVSFWKQSSTADVLAAAP